MLKFIMVVVFASFVAISAPVVAGGTGTGCGGFVEGYGVVDTPNGPYNAMTVTWQQNGSNIQMDLTWLGDFSQCTYDGMIEAVQTLLYEAPQSTDQVLSDTAMGTVYVNDQQFAPGLSVKIHRN